MGLGQPPHSRSSKRHGGARCPFVSQRMDHMLDQLSHPNSTIQIWDDVKETSTAFMGLVKSVQDNPQRWPSWLVLKLAAAIQRGLQDDILGLSGPDPVNSIICQPYGIGDHVRKGTVLHGFVTMSQLMSSLARLVRRVIYGTSATTTAVKPAMTEMIWSRDAPTAPSLVASMGRAASELEAFMRTHKVLSRPLDKSKHDSQVFLDTYLPVAVGGLSNGLLNLYLAVTHCIPPFKPGAPLQCLDAITRLTAVTLESWPGPNVPVRAPGSQPLPPAEAAAAAYRASRGTVSAYQGTEIPMCVSVAARLTKMMEICQILLGSRQEAGEDDDLPQEVLEVLATPEMEFVLQVGLCVAVSESYQAQAALGRGGSTRRPGAKSGANSTCDASSQQQQHVQPWHLLLADALGLEGALPFLSKPVGRAEDSVCVVPLAMALFRCNGFQKELGVAPRSPPIPAEAQSGSSGSTSCVEVFSALFLALSESVMITAHPPGDLVFCVPHTALLMALVLSAGTLPGGNGFPKQLVQPVLGVLLPCLLDALRAHDSGNNSQPRSNGGLFLGSQQEEADGPRRAFTKSLAGVYLGIVTAGERKRRLAPAAAMHGLSEAIAQHPDILLPSLSALMRLRAQRDQATVTTILTDLDHKKPPPLGPALGMVEMLAAVSRKRRPPLEAALDIVELLGAGRQLAVYSISGGRASTSASTSTSGTSTGTSGSPGTGLGTSTGAAAPTSIASALIADRKGAGAAWAGDAASWSKYAFWALEHLPVFGKDLLLSLAAAQLQAVQRISRGPSAAGAGEAAGAAAALVPPAATAAGLGAMLLPLVMASARALLLAADVLLLPANLLASSELEITLEVDQRHELARTVKHLLDPDFTAAVCISSCVDALRLLSQLLPQLTEAPQQDEAVGAAGEAGASAADEGRGSYSKGGSSTKPGKKHFVKVVPEKDMAQLLQQASECIEALQAAQSRLGEVMAQRQRRGWSRNNEYAGVFENVQGACIAADSAEHGSSSGSSSSFPSCFYRPKAPAQLQVFAWTLLSSLPSYKICSHPCCVQLGLLSEKELCRRECSRCGTAYCSKECSVSHWKQHKPLCRRLGAMQKAADPQAETEPQAGAGQGGDCPSKAAAAAGEGGAKSGKKGHKKRNG